MTTFFLHGLDSSGQGTKGRYFAEHFPQVRCPDFSGTLDDRVAQLSALCRQERELTFIGSSFGGLMATVYACAHPEQVKQLVLLAPALNFEYTPPARPIEVPTLLVIGDKDDVCPPDLVIPAAEKTFSQLAVEVVDDDHMLHGTFRQMDWRKYID